MATPTSRNKNILEPQLPQHRSVLEEYGYKLLKVIGHGSYGTVHEAYFERWKSNVAVKIISKKKASQDYLTKFLPRELQVLKILRHKNLISFYQSIETTSRMYIIEELATGGDVLDRIRNSGACTEPLAGKWFCQLSQGVAYIHSKGIVHRDLKLDNLLLDKKDNIKITDFGFAKVAMPQTLSETYCGSFAYAPPEILLGHPYNPFLSDVWSMGVILFTLITASLPFDDSNLKKLIRDTQKEVKFPPGKNIPEDCKSLILKLLTGVSKRLAARDILQQPWILKFLPEHQVMDDNKGETSPPVPLHPPPRPPPKPPNNMPKTYSDPTELPPTKGSETTSKRRSLGALRSMGQDTMAAARPVKVAK